MSDINDLNESPSLHPHHLGETLAEEEGRILDTVIQETVEGVAPGPGEVAEALDLLETDPTFEQKFEAAIQEGEFLAGSIAMGLAEDDDGDED